MTSFDALRASHVGAISYLCKRQPPAELLGCWPLSSTSDKADLSRYGNAYTGTLANPSGTNTLAKVKLNSNTAFTFSLDLSRPFSIDFEFGLDHGGGQGRRTTFTLGSLIFATGYQYYPDYDSYNGEQLDTGSTYIDYNGSHFAITYDGTTLRRFVNGTFQRQVDVSMSGISNGISVIENNIMCFGNLRVVQKCLGISAYPVPSVLYTGYETL